MVDPNRQAEMRREYIVGALREAGAMYPEDAESYLAEHEAVVEAAARAAGHTAGLRAAADRIDNDDTCDCGGCDTCQPRRMAAELRALAAAGQTPAPQPECTCHVGDGLPRQHAAGCARIAPAPQPETCGARTYLGICGLRPGHVGTQHDLRTPGACTNCGHSMCTGDGPCDALMGVSGVAEDRCGCGEGPPAPQPETAPDTCARCGHTADEHGPRGCTVTGGPNRCGCPRDAAGATAYWPLIDPGAARWEQHGTTWTRDEYGNAHSLGPATTPNGGEMHVVADDSDDPEHVDDCPRCETTPDACEHARRLHTGTLARGWMSTYYYRCRDCKAEFTELVDETPPQATAPDAEPGTPDLREQYTAVLLDDVGRLQPRHVADPDALIRDLLAVRDDALTTAQQAVENLTVEVTRLRRLERELRTQLRDAEEGITAAIRQRKQAEDRAFAAEQQRDEARQRITAARAECDISMHVPGTDLLGRAVRAHAHRIHTALTGGTAQDGGAS